MGQKIISVPGQGDVAFPDSMSDDDISRVVRIHQPEPEARGTPEWSSWRTQRMHDLNDAATSQHAPEDKGFLHGLWDSVNPFKVLTAPGAGGQDGPGNGPIGKVIGGIVRAGVDQAGKAKDAFQSGDYVSAAGHGLAAAIPGAGPAAANIGEAIGSGKTGEGLGQAVGLGLTLAAPHVVAGAGRVVNAVKPGATALAENALRSSAETQYGRVLNPTTKGNKLRTAEIVPELIDRGVTAPTLKGLQGKAQAQIANVGAAIGDEWQNLPAGTSTPLQPIFDRLQAEIDNTHSVANSSGKMIPKGPEAAKAIGNIDKLQEVLMDVAEKDPQTGTLGIPVEKARALRQYFDQVQKSAGSFEGKNLNDASTAAAHEVAADSIRAELGKQFPDIAALNKEYAFWKNVNQVVSDTLTRRQGQAVPLTTRLAEGAGYGKAGPIGAAVMKALATAVRSPAWGTIGAVMKDRLADAIALGNQEAVQFYATKIGQAMALTGQQSQIAQPATAATR